jgi:hypothetical protein
MKTKCKKCDSECSVLVSNSGTISSGCAAPVYVEERNANVSPIFRSLLNQMSEVMGGMKDV